MFFGDVIEIDVDAKGGKDEDEADPLVGEEGMGEPDDGEEDREELPEGREDRARQRLELFESEVDKVLAECTEQ